MERRGFQLIHAVITADDSLTWWLANHESVFVKDGWGFQAMHWAAVVGNLPAMIMMRHDHDAPIDEPTKNGKYLLHLASENGHLPIVEWLVNRQHVAADLKTKDGEDAIFFAALNDEDGIIDFLDEKLGHDVDKVLQPIAKKGTSSWKRPVKYFKDRYRGSAVARRSYIFRGDYSSWEHKSKRLLYAGANCVIYIVPPERGDLYMIYGLPCVTIPSFQMPTRYNVPPDHVCRIFHIRPFPQVWSELCQ